MENEEKAAQVGSASVAAKPAAKRPRRGAIVGGVIAAVVVVAGISAFMWHEQPSFCNAICHTPMDGYLETYEAEPGQAATDKWGNQVADASGMLSAVHRTNDSSATCLSCPSPSSASRSAKASAGQAATTRLWPPTATPPES
ncbi:hypothetical protein [uncultured Senegalimassilia sp.]|uniref:hypothetical protein n=1 Tax=uncultured Senegalimassilia sp. TaxID=1714350 RepID=UPI00258D2437|nr:hypothetical protein [uncultured Senegalimassilia sp.]